MSKQDHIFGAIEKALKALKGIKSVEVDGEDDELDVTVNYSDGESITLCIYAESSEN